MSLDADLIVDRRRIRRKLTFWRVLAIAVIILAIAGMAVAWSNRTGFAGAGSYIARVTIKGLIRDDEERVKQLDKLAQSSTYEGRPDHLEVQAALERIAHRVLVQRDWNDDRELMPAGGARG